MGRKMTTTVSSATYETKLQERVEIAHKTIAFSFEKPAGFSFRPGQFVDISLMTADDTNQNIAFSLASSPHQVRLTIATRMRNTPFKQQFAALALNSTIKMEGPLGNFVLATDVNRPAVFIAGGIGVTPFRSMIIDAIHRQLPLEMFLFYSNRRPEDAALFSEFERLSNLHSNFHFVPTMTNLVDSKAGWSGETGHIDNKLLSKYISVSSPLFYIAGAPRMVNAIRHMLCKMKVGEKDIRSEDFVGY